MVVIRFFHIGRTDKHEERDDVRERASYTSMLSSSKGLSTMQTGRAQQPVINLSILSQHTNARRCNKRAFSTTTHDNGKHDTSHPPPDRNDDESNASTSRSSSMDPNESTSTSTTAPTAQTRARIGAHSLKALFQKYGMTFVGTYFTLYIITISTIFTGLDSGYIDPATLSDIQFNFPWHSGTGAEAEADAREFRSSVEYVVGYMRKFECTTPYAELVENNQRLGNLALAWVAAKFTEPIRLPVTVMIVPRVAKFLGQKTHDDDDDHVKEEDGDSAGSAARLK